MLPLSRMSLDRGSRRDVADALATLVLSAAAAAAGLAVTGLYRDNAAMIRQAQSSDVATLVAAVPMLAAGLWWSRKGAAAGQVVVLGALGFLAYSYAIFAFSVVIGPATPAHIAIVGLAAWSLGLKAVRLEASPLDNPPGTRLPRRTTAVFLLVVVVLFGVSWLGQILGAITSGHLPPAVADLNLPTNPIFTLDLAFALPVLTLGGIRLIRGDPRGRAMAVALLVFSVLMGLEVLVIFLLSVQAGVPVDASITVVFAVVVLIGVALLARGLMPPGRGHPSVARQR